MRRLRLTGRWGSARRRRRPISTNTACRVYCVLGTVQLDVPKQSEHVQEGGALQVRDHGFHGTGARAQGWMNVGKRANALSSQREFAAPTWGQRMAQARRGQACTCRRKRRRSFAGRSSACELEGVKRALQEPLDPGVGLGVVAMFALGPQLPAARTAQDQQRGQELRNRRGRCCWARAQAFWRRAFASMAGLFAGRLREAASIKGAPPATGRGGAEKQSTLKFTCFGPAYARPRSLQNPSLHLPPTATCLWLLPLISVTPTHPSPATPSPRHALDLRTLPPQSWISTRCWRGRFRPVCARGLLSHALRLDWTDGAADANIRKAAEDQLSQAAESDFVSAPRPRRPGLALAPSTRPLTPLSPSTSPSSRASSPTSSPSRTSEPPPVSRSRTPSRHASTHGYVRSRSDGRPWTPRSRATSSSWPSTHSRPRTPAPASLPPSSSPPLPPSRSPRTNGPS